MSAANPFPDPSSLALGPQRRVAIWILIWIVIGLLTIAAIQPEPQPKPWEYLSIGAVYGTFFGHTTLAGAWMALGPLPLVWRLPLSLVWLAALLLALGVNMNLYIAPDAEILAVFGGVSIGQWILAQTPLWMLAMGYGVRLRRGDAQSDRSERQFGIRQLLIVTFIVAVVLGIGRVVVGAVLQREDWDFRPLIIISFLAVAGMVMTLPLLLAALLPRHAAPASLVVLVLIGLGTAGEVPLLAAIHAVPGGGPEPGHFYGLSGIQAAWVLAIAATLRVNGYRLSVWN